MPNRLAKSKSPYLMQHAHNPVNWYEWGEEAFAEAKKQDKPIFLSIGYSSCHWCHVMAEESFENEQIAAILNRDYISIKVDREERPDVDETFMLAVQMISKRGGWPMSVFLTPDKKPFFAGTYFPPVDQGQYPGFATILVKLGQMWRTSRKDVLDSANQIAAHLTQAAGRTLGSLTSKIDPQLFKDCFNALKSDFDGKNGGFGEAPKFPQHSSLSYLLDYAAVNPDDAPEALSMVFQSLQAMSMGGIFDQIEGGFHRYSTDAYWHLPHFEKMLVDNALLVDLYLRATEIAYAIDAPFADAIELTAIKTLSWLKSKMMSEDGLFYSAIDADTDGMEGFTYLWTKQEIEGALGDAADSFCELYSVMEDGNYLDEATQQKTGLNVLHRLGGNGDEFAAQLSTLYQIRESRPQPMVDFKAVASWNGLVLRALASSGDSMVAERCASTWIAAHKEFGALPHQITDGEPSGHAFLDDYAAQILGFVAIAESTGKSEFADFAQVLKSEMIENFLDKEKFGFFFTSEKHDKLFGRSKPCLDQSGPSANALAIQALLATNEIELAEQCLMAVLGWAQKMPRACEAMISCALNLVNLKSEISGLPGLDIPAPPKPITEKVRVTLSHRELEAGSSNLAEGVVKISIPEGLHLNTATPPARWLIPTEVKFEGVRAQVDYPAGENDRYEGVIEIPFKISVKANETQEFEVRIRYQACTETECLSPEEAVFDGVVIG